MTTGGFLPETRHGSREFDWSAPLAAAVQTDPDQLIVMSARTHDVRCRYKAVPPGQSIRHSKIRRGFPLAFQLLIQGARRDLNGEGNSDSRRIRMKRSRNRLKPEFQRK